jgi:5'-nucleotidase / UDP-sugar diphosphatase
MAQPSSLLIVSAILYVLCVPTFRLIHSFDTKNVVKPAAGSALNDLNGEDKIQKYYIKTLKSGQRVGICGITIKATTELSSFPDKGTTLADEVTTASTCVAELQGLGINKIGLLTHVGYSQDIAWFTKIPGVSFIIGGHSHSLLGNELYDKFKFPTQGKYATIVNNVCIVQAWEYVRVVGALTIEFDTKGNVASCTGAARVPLNPDLFQVRDATPSFYLGKSDAAKATAWLVSQGPFVSAVEDPSVVQALKPFVDQLSVKAQEVIANAPEPICHTYGEASLACPGKEVRSRLGGGVCNLVSQGFLFNVPTADVALQNRGGCRVNIRSGPFSKCSCFVTMSTRHVCLFSPILFYSLWKRVRDSSVYQRVGYSGLDRRSDPPCDRGFHELLLGPWRRRRIVCLCCWPSIRHRLQQTFRKSYFQPGGQQAS